MMQENNMRQKVIQSSYLNYFLYFLDMFNMALTPSGLSHFPLDTFHISRPACRTFHTYFLCCRDSASLRFIHAFSLGTFNFN